MARAVNIVSVAPPVFSEDNRSVLLSAVLAVDPEDMVAARKHGRLDARALLKTAGPAARPSRWAGPRH